MGRNLLIIKGNLRKNMKVSLPKTKRITPESKLHQSLSFYKDDIVLIAKRLRRPFHTTFNRGYRMTAQVENESLTFYPKPNINPVHARHCMKYLGIHPDVIESAIRMIEDKQWGPIPKREHVQFDLWFKTLDNFRGGKIQEVVASTPDAMQKWDKRLLACRTNWEEAKLSDESIASITQTLFRDTLGEVVELDRLRMRLRRWKKGAYKVSSHGAHIVRATPRSLKDP